MRIPCLPRGVWLACALFAWRPCLAAQEAAPPLPAGAVYVVVHVDMVPASADAGLALLQAYGTNCRQEAGARRFEVLRETGRPNHFALLELWDNEAARQANEASDATRRFRAQLQPLLGSPFDERLSHAG